MTLNIRLLIHSTSGNEYHNVLCYWIKEDDITAEIHEYLEQIENGLVIDDNIWMPEVDMRTRAFIKNIGTENSQVWSKGEALQNVHVVKMYTIVTTEY